jgi:hypothetical protein
MSSREACNCDQSKELTKALEDVLEKQREFAQRMMRRALGEGVSAEDAGEALDQASKNAQIVLNEYAELTRTMYDCPYCDKPGGH